MALNQLYALLGTILLATNNNAADIQAELDVGENDNDLMKMIFKKLELLGNRNQNGTTLSQDHTELASALLQVAPAITIKGNITDPDHHYTISFIVRASKNPGLLDSDSGDDDDVDEDEDEELDYWRSSGGVFKPLVSVVEPLVLSFGELLVNGVLSTFISNFLESTALMGDGRLV